MPLYADMYRAHLRPSSFGHAVFPIFGTEMGGRVLGNFIPSFASSPGPRREQLGEQRPEDHE